MYAFYRYYYFWSNVHTCNFYTGHRMAWFMWQVPVTLLFNSTALTFKICPYILGPICVNGQIYWAYEESQVARWFVHLSSLYYYVVRQLARIYKIV